MTAPPESDRVNPAYKWTIGAGLAVLQSLVYFGIGHTHLTRSTEILRTRLDDAIPFWPWTSWCYLPFYAAIFLIAIAGFRRKRLFNRAVKAVLIVMSLGALGHLAVGAEYPRPVLYPPSPACPTHSSPGFKASTHRGTSSPRCMSLTRRCSPSSCARIDGGSGPSRW